MDEIIIDNVDVSKRKELMQVNGEEPYCDSDSSLKFICKGNNCNYKQLKRKEQECERLKEENEKLNKITGIFSARLCEKYRQALQDVREYIGTCCHRFSENHKNLCFGCEYDKEVCDYSIILAKINEVIGKEE